MSDAVRRKRMQTFAPTSGVSQITSPIQNTLSQQQPLDAGNRNTVHAIPGAKFLDGESASAYGKHLIRANTWELSMEIQNILRIWMKNGGVSLLREAYAADILPFGVFTTVKAKIIFHVLHSMF